MLIGGNFGPGDLLVTPTFSPENLPANYAELQEKAKKFFDLLRKSRRKRGDQTKYIYAPHHTDTVRWHVHALVNAVGLDDWETIKSLWPWGDVHITRVQDTKYSTPDAMAGYLIGGWTDRPNSARAWCASTNLKKIVVTTYREHNQSVNLTLPANCELCEADNWITPYGSYEYMSFFRRGTLQDNSNEADTTQASREPIDRGAL